MARIYSGRFNRFIEKLFNTKEGRASLDTVAPQIFPTLQFTSGVENSPTQGWERFGCAIGVAAGGAGNFAQIRFRNPLGSGVVAVFENLIAANSVAAADTPSLAIGSGGGGADLGTIVSLVGNRLPDTRQRGTPTLICSTATAPISGVATITRGSFGVNGQVAFIQTANQEIQVLPGEILQMHSNTANQQFFGGFIWRERVLESSELT